MHVEEKLVQLLRISLRGDRAAVARVGKQHLPFALDAGSDELAERIHGNRRGGNVV